MKLPILLAALALTSAARADEINPNTALTVQSNGATFFGTTNAPSPVPLVVESKTVVDTIVTLGGGGCIVGPFKVVTQLGGEVYSLAPGESMPIGCDKRSTK